MDPLPTINKAYSMIQKVEKQRQVNMTSIESSNGVALFMKQGNNQSYRKDGNKKIAGRGGSKKNVYNKDTYFKLHRYPNWYNDLKEHRSAEKTHLTNAMDTPFDKDQENSIDKGADMNDLAGIIQQEIAKYMTSNKVGGINQV
ncbi:conserved hypothetical protein [Ricinus communis]|uniref:Uncharacterized protein n=1 Tax=Ricinus communis TaxID=3988 RepID=B9SLB3_RICCO|nr:conserved hypothetical protein [Ricinus communis]